MKRKLIGQVGASAILLTTIFGVAPATADGVILPSNANGVDNSGIQAILCKNSLHMRLPVTQAESPVVENQALYNEVVWTAVRGETQIESVNRGGDWIGFDHSLASDLAETITDETATITLFYRDSNYNEASFDIELPVTDVPFAGGDGSYANPFQVSTVDQLSQMRCEKNKYFELMNDIDLEGVDWLPIGLGRLDSGVWTGSLEGNGHTISNLEVAGTNNATGLFARVRNSQMRNLVIKDFTVSGYNNVGSLVGETRTSSYSNITVAGSVVTGNSNVGVFVGHSDYRSAFSNLNVSGKSFGLPFHYWRGDGNGVEVNQVDTIGGVIGFEDGDGGMWNDITADVDVEIQDVAGKIDNVDVTQLSSTIKVRYVGGFAGRTGELSSVSNLNIKADIKLGDDELLPSESENVGGVFGRSEEAYMEGISAEVTIEDKGYSILSNAGGFVGETESLTISNVQVESSQRLELGASGLDFLSPRDIGGFVGDSGYDAGVHDVKSVATVDIVRLVDSNMRNIGGFSGYDDDVLYQRIDSTATLTMTDANGSNNSLNVELTEGTLDMVHFGGFVGGRDDYTTYREISSNADVTLTSSQPFQSVGGFVGNYGDSDGASFKNVISRGSVTVPNGSKEIGAFAGQSSHMRLTNVLISTDLNVNGSTESIGILAGIFYRDDQTLADNVRIFDSFVNSELGNPAEQAGVPDIGVTESSMKSSQFLKAHGFDLVKIFKHVEGQWPTVRLRLSTSGDETTVVVPANIKKGRTNADTSISVGAQKKNSVRSYFVNMPNASAGKTAALFVIRDGKKITLINKAKLNRVGNWYATSKFKLALGDVLRVEIGGKKLRTLSL